MAAGDVKGFCGGRHHDQPLADAVIGQWKNRVLLAGINQIMVDLIRDDNQIVPAGKIANGAQLVGGPHAAPRVMWRAEDQHFFAARHHRIIAVEIQRIAAILNCQRALDYRPVTGAQNAEKRMVNRGK